jgi:5-bromo-4-chloroindolyl phosphate hydrolysis protein
VKFADLYAQTRDPKARADYEALLDDLERNLRHGRRRLLLDDRTNLDIEIEVLRERLEREGVHAK